jgi:competence protein ComGC
MFKKFSPFATIITMLIVLFVIITILSSAVPSIIKMRDKISDRANYIISIDDVENLPVR